MRNRNMHDSEENVSRYFWKMVVAEISAEEIGRCFRWSIEGNL